MRLKSTALALSLALASLCAPLPAWSEQAPVAVTLPAGVSRYTEVEGITEYRLANGLRVLLAPDAAKPTTTVNVTYLVGSRLENYGETGMAHLLEHLVFKGTPSLPGTSIVQELGKRGMRYNGTTSFDRTNYFETFAASDDNLDWVLKMEADRMVNSFIARKDLDSEMTVVRNEMEMGENDPAGVLMQRMVATAFLWHNYGKFPIGARSDVENVRIENLQAFYRKYYQPDNAVLVVAGRFDPAVTLRRIAGYFGAIAKPSRVLEPSYTVEPAQDGARSVTLKRVGDMQLVGAMYHVPAASHADYPPFWVLAEILGDTPNGRLHKALVEKGKAAAAWSNGFALKEPGYGLFFAKLNKQQSRDEAKQLLLDVVEGVARRPITEDELKRAKTSLLNDFEDLQNDPSALGVALSSAIAVGDWRLFFVGRDRIAAVTLADVQRVAETYLREPNRTLGEFIPTDKAERVAIPPTPEVAPLVEGYQGRAALAEGEAFDPTPANIEQRTTRTALANGMKLALLPKTTRGNTVNGSLVLRFGDESSLKGRKSVAAMTAGMLRRGTSKLSRQQIADRLDELKASMSIGGDGGVVSINFETRRNALPAFLDLLREILREPAFPQGEFEQFRTSWLTNVEGQRREPGAVAQNALARYANPYPQGDVRYVESVDESLASINAIKLDELTAFHRQFYGANNGELALVGDFDAAAVQQQLTRLFGGWNSPASYARVPGPFVPAEPTAMRFETPDKANAVLLATQRLPLRDDEPDYPALLIGEHVLGGGSLKSRLMDRLRQKEGLSYGAGSWLVAGSQDANGGLGIQAIFAPQNLARVQQGVQEELARLLRDGVTEQEVEEAKSGLLQASRVARTQDGTLAGGLANQLYLKRTMAFSAEREERIKAATASEVNAALRKYLDAGKLVQVVAGDFAAAGKAGSK